METVSCRVVPYKGRPERIDERLDKCSGKRTMAKMA